MQRRSQYTENQAHKLSSLVFALPISQKYKFPYPWRNGNSDSTHATGTLDLIQSRLPVSSRPAAKNFVDSMGVWFGNFDFTEPSLGKSWFGQSYLTLPTLAHCLVSLTPTMPAMSCITFVGARPEVLVQDAAGPPADPPSSGILSSGIMIGSRLFANSGHPPRDAARGAELPIRLSALMGES
ncbi:uncharacterized protein CLUP02_03017 [Colletotrichum lupini]|uniref:Uncharacterized protein n=1 Tax=Colletotrichum lupini TaxID=145971 RepID=A0A9Q8SI33_9PEZI|nr:uncharacterized protein CLUP02_03017 [Colletotrichum lupini]UQC77548.1 hypothetical protein CLUP02_03017 [Colletotrichum lupini]